MLACTGQQVCKLQTALAASFSHLILFVIVRQEGKLKPQAVISHILPLREASKGYDVFNAKRADPACLPVICWIFESGNTHAMHVPGSAM